jgi:hypothetical protein
MSDVNHLEAALQQLLRERDELDGIIFGLQKRLGIAQAASTSPIPPAKSLRGTSAFPADSVVYRGVFFNLSVTKAAEKLLKTVGRPLKTPEILSAFQQAEYENAKGENARSALYTSLSRSKDFVKVLPDTWDVAEKHPEAAEKKLEEMAAKANKKKKGNKAAKAKTELKPQAVDDLKVA